ncbi:MAG: helix-turn-helix domain-containing protein [Ruminococcus flavefaciens]|nr:helix-turn-helix domain-containing protein [Ruminococcus flavefaciens]
MTKKFIKADEVAEMLEISKAHAYKIIRQLNGELEEKGFITISGRVSRQYFLERLYGNAPDRKEVT